MDPLIAFILTWTLCGGIASHVARRRHGNGPLWTVIGQLFGPLAIPFAFMLKPTAAPVR